MPVPPALPPSVPAGDVLAVLRGAPQQRLPALAVLVEQALPTATVSVTVLEVAGPRTAVASAAAARDLDALQYEAGRGPCLEAARGRRVQEVPDTRADLRWDGVPAALAAAGALSVLSVPLPAVATAGLNVYACQPRALSGVRDAAEAVAALVGLVLQGDEPALARVVDGLERAGRRGGEVQRAVERLQRQRGLGPGAALTALRELAAARATDLAGAARLVLEAPPG